METIEAGSMSMTWDPSTRVAVLAMAPYGTGAQAQELTGALERWIGNNERAFALLSDSTAGDHETADWRTVWGRFYMKHCREGVVAGFGASPDVQIAGALFASGSGVRLQLFAHEPEARAWLRAQGFAA